MGETQAPSEHCVSPVGQLDWQVPLLHTSMPVHIVVQEPQWAAFEATQLPLHESRPGPQTHWPDWQTWSVAQTLPHAPQFRASVATVAQPPAHIVWPAPQVWPSTLPWHLPRPARRRRGGK